MNLIDPMEIARERWNVSLAWVSLTSMLHEVRAAIRDNEYSAAARRRANESLWYMENVEKSLRSEAETLGIQVRELESRINMLDVAMLASLEQSRIELALAMERIP